MTLFTYGTLMIPSVMEAVAGRPFPLQRAVLKDYARFRVAGASYPGLVWQKGAQTDGVLYLGVDPDTLARLDAFEGAFYRRIGVAVETGDGDRVPAETYVLAASNAPPLTSEPWDVEAFRRNHLDAFLEAYPGFRAL